jgi:hypothetical protein
MGSTEPLREMSTGNLTGGGGGKPPAHKADNLTAICGPIVQKMWDPERLTTLRAFLLWRIVFIFKHIYCMYYVTLRYFVL